MDEAFLLAARDSIIAGIEIRDEDALIVLQELMYNSCLACVSHFEDDMPAIGEDPDIIICALDADLRLIGVDEGAMQELLDQEAFGRRIVPGNVFDKIDSCPDACALTKHILYHLYDDAVRETKDNTLVNDPYLKGMPK